MTGTLTLALVVVGGAAGVAALLRANDGEPRVERCAAVADGTEWYLAPDQAETAALLAGTSVRRGMPARAATIAIATGLQESKLRNIDYGDRDSVGIFQQRPSQGWGSVEEIMDPVYSTNAFYDALAQVDGYEEMAVTEAAQTVQRSAFPDAYAQHEARSRAWASALTGWSPAALTCTLPEADGVGDPAALAARLERDLGLVAVVEGGLVRIDLSAAGEPSRAGWAAAQWAVAVAWTHDVVRVRHEDQVWDRTTGTWAPDETDPLASGVVELTLHD
ncbi:hypothetical protein [Cellulomonas sp. APG4]|uniref:hypothetical protein n=1 Tax=Cellulomonas sp. APG4 TaxID=1538656 RepID=UPI00351B8D38